MQLSFACVAALIVWASPMTQALRVRGVPAWLAGAVSATVLCSVATAPILQLRTGAAPLTGIVANLVAVPLAGAILVIGLAGSILSLVLDPIAPDVVGATLLAPAGIACELLLTIARRAAALPAAQSSSIAINVVIPGIVGTWMVARRRMIDPGMRRRAARVVGVLVLGCVVLGLDATTLVPGASRITGARAAAAAPGVLRIAVLDIGQGDATLIADGSAAVLVDTGPPDGRVVERVRELGIDHVDGIVLTHDSLDHRGGFERALASLHPGWVARPRLAPGPWQRFVESAPRMIDVCAGDGFDVGSAHVDVLHPRCDGTIVPRTGDLHNDGAMVLLISHGDVHAVLPADAEAPVLDDLDLPRLDLLRISHHGSEDPQLDELLAQVTPAAAAISAGEGNDYGHPRRQVLRDLDRAGVLVRRTDRDGTIEFRSNGRTLSIVE
jgi:competence protein ComEC